LGNPFRLYIFHSLPRLFQEELFSILRKSSIKAKDPVCPEKDIRAFFPGLIILIVNGGARLVIVLMNMQRVTGMGYIAFVFMDMGVVP
jgi:hypothetical protein